MSDREKVLTIHQPETFPWLGFFNKMMLADEYIVLDNVQFRKNYFQNRNQFLTSQGPIYLTVPIEASNHKVIRDVRISSSHIWKSKHLKTIEQNYAKAPFFSEHIDFIRNLYAESFDFLIDFNLAVITYLRLQLDVDTPLTLASDHGRDGQSSELLHDLCQSMDANTYLSGRDGRNYLDLSLFKASDIRVIFQEFTHPEYNQFNAKEFTPFMSTFDLLFNLSPEESRALIVAGGTFCEV